MCNKDSPATMPIRYDYMLLAPASGAELVYPSLKALVAATGISRSTCCRVLAGDTQRCYVRPGVHALLRRVRLGTPTTNNDK